MASRKAVSVMPPQATAPRSEETLTPEDVALHLKYPSVKTVYEQTRLRIVVRPMRCMRAGKFLRFYWSDIERCLRGVGVAYEVSGSFGIRTQDLRVMSAAL